MARFVDPYTQYLDINGDVLASATMHFYFSRTNELRAIYSDTLLQVEAPNPQVADSAGRFITNIFMPDVFFRVEVKDSNGVTVWQTSDGDALPFISTDNSERTFTFAPVMTLLEQTPLAFSDGGADLQITNTLVITDSDSTNLVSAAVSIKSGFVSGEDSLIFVNTGSITGSFSASTGILDLTGTTTVANYQAALRSVDFRNTTSGPTAGSRVINFMVTDTEHNGTNSVTFTLVNGEEVLQPADRAVVVAIGVAPVLAAIESGDLALTKIPTVDLDSVVTSTMTVSDADNANMLRGYVQLITGFVTGEDMLTFTDTANITGVFSASTGRLSLTGTTTKANYQAAFRDVNYFNSVEDYTSQTRTARFAVTDSDSNISNFQERDITISDYTNPSCSTSLSFSLINTQRSMTIDESTGNMITASATTVYIHSGITSSISSSFAAPGTGTDLDALGYDSTTGSLIISAKDSSGSGNFTIYMMTGVTSSISSQYLTPIGFGTSNPNNGAQEIKAITSINGNLVLANQNTYDTFYTMTGITSTVSSAFASPGAQPGGLAWTGVNLMSSDEQNDLLYTHSGNSSTVTSSCDMGFELNALAYYNGKLYSLRDNAIVYRHINL